MEGPAMTRESAAAGLAMERRGGLCLVTLDRP